MNSISSIAQSGLAAASLQVQVAANNIANASSSGPVPGTPNAADYPKAYVAERVSQTQAAGGGVNARITNAANGTVEQSDPTAPYADSRGMVASPNVDIVGEVVGLLTAKISFAANVAVLRTYSDMQKTLIDIKT